MIGRLARGQVARGPGVTLVELLVGALVGAIIIGMAWGLVRLAGRSMQAAESRLEPRQAAHLVLTTLRLALVDALVYTITDDGRRIVMLLPGGLAQAWHDRDARQVRFQPPRAAASYALPATRVSEFLVEAARPGLVRLAVEIERPAAGRARPAPLWVVDEVLVPAVASRLTLLPYQSVVEMEAIP